VLLELKETKGSLEGRTLNPGLCTESSRSPQFQLQSPRQNTNTSANSQTPTQTIEGSGVRGQQQRELGRYETADITANIRSTAQAWQSPLQGTSETVPPPPQEL
jgi:hypothetical protein